LKKSKQAGNRVELFQADTEIDLIRPPTKRSKCMSAGKQLATRKRNCT
jgi:hypothetical protein